jgi:hypothetical protein
LISATRLEHVEQLCLRRLRRQVGPRSLDAHRCPTEDREPDQADHARHEDDAGDELLDRAAAADPPGTAVGIEYFGRRVPATVATEPLVDQEMARIRR